MSSRPLLSIAAELSAPPSSPSCFRDVTLYAVTFKGYEVVATTPEEMWLAYDRWFKGLGLYDYLTELLPERELPESTTRVAIVGGPGARLTAHNLRAVIGLL